MSLYRECEHQLDDTFCDVKCEAYVRGDGMIEVEPTDRICAVHGTCTWIDNVYLCASHDPDDPCSTFDVVRATTNSDSTSSQLGVPKEDNG